MDAYHQQVTEFLLVCQHTDPAKVDGTHLRRYMAALRERGLSHRTVFNNYTSIACFLKLCGIDHKNLLPCSERPTPDDRVYNLYIQAQGEDSAVEDANADMIDSPAQQR